MQKCKIQQSYQAVKILPSFGHQSRHLHLLHDYSKQVPVAIELNWQLHHKE